MSNNLTAFLTGQIPFIIIVSAILTAIASVFLLWFYRKAVVRSMSVLAGVSSESSEPLISSKVPNSIASPVFSVVDIRTVNKAGYQTNGLYLKAIHSINHVTLSYAVAVLVYALIFTAVKMICAGDGFFIFRFLLLLSIYCWPVVLISFLINPSHIKRILVFYAAMSTLIGGIAILRNSSGKVSPVDLIVLWSITNAPATALLLTFLNRKVRAVGPLVLVFMIIAITGSTVFIPLIINNKYLFIPAASFWGLFSFNAEMMFLLIQLAGFVFFGVFGWMLLKYLGHQYQKKSMSEQSITIDAIFLLFCIVESIDNLFEWVGWIFAGLAAFVLYKITFRVTLRLFSEQNKMGSTGRCLLLLRVFALGKKSARLYDAITSVWLRTGSVSMISGPDLATTTVEPHEFLDFMGGHLSRQFVKGEKELEERIAGLDTLPDPDGRYRVNEFFCRADTWQMTMKRLARESDAVLMDLRSFSANNKGCLYELQQLFNIVKLDMLLLVIDASTDRAFLETSIRDIWQTLRADSPNAKLSQPLVRCFSVSQFNHEETGKLLSILYNANATA